MATIVRPNARRRALILLLALLAACVAGVVVARYGGQWNISTALLIALFGLMVAFPLLLCGSMAAHKFYLARKSEIQAGVSRGWPTTQGKVLVSEIQWYHSPKAHIYTPVVRYEYVVDGRRYEADVIEFGLTPQNSQKKAEAYVKGRDAGAVVTVHYNPDDPAKATLDTTSRQAVLLRRTGWVLIGIVAMIYGLMAYGYVR